MTEKDRLEETPAALSDEELAAASPLDLPGREAMSVVTLGGPSAYPVGDAAEAAGGAAGAAATDPGPGQIDYEPGVPTE